MNGKITIQAIAAEVKAIRTAISSLQPRIKPKAPDRKQVKGITMAHVTGMADFQKSPMEYDLVESASRTSTVTSWRTFTGCLGILSFRLSSARTNDVESDVEHGGRKKRKVTSNRSVVVNLLLGFRSCRRGYRLRLSDTFDQWTFNSIRIVPQDSPIFKFCRQGNVQGVRELLSHGLASVFDVDGNGQSPLYVCLTPVPRLCCVAESFLLACL
jgi:hypothetical protein